MATDNHSAIVSSGNNVPRVHIVGKKNCGKTTLVCEIVKRLTEQGFQVATIKHTHHNHELDTPGKDSWQHRTSGAGAVGILTAEMTALYFPESRSKVEQDRYARMEAAFQGFDVILVEGDLQATAPKVEVWRQDIIETPYAASRADISAVITDDQISLPHPLVARSEIQPVAELILKLAGIERPGLANIDR